MSSSPSFASVAHRRRMPQTPNSQGYVRPPHVGEMNAHFIDVGVRGSGRMRPALQHPSES